MDQEAEGWTNSSDTSLLTTFYALGSRDLEKKTDFIFPLWGFLSGEGNKPVHQKAAFNEPQIVTVVVKELKHLWGDGVGSV